MHYGLCVYVSDQILVLMDLNARVAAVTTEGHGVPGVHERGEKLVKLCAKRQIVISNTWFKKGA